MRCTTQPWNIGKLWLQKNRINIDPPYQRESGVWSLEKKQLFIDSILNGFDVPKLYFHDLTANQGPFGFAVVDGKQRLGAVWDFLSGHVPLSEDFQFSGDVSFFGDGEVPSGNQTYSSMNDLQKEYFRSQAIDVVEVADAEEYDIEELFSRLNNGEPLNAAEKRNAMGGRMIKLVRELAKDDKFDELLRFPDNRMSHHEVAAKLIRLELSHREGQGIFCDLKKRFLDELVDKNRGLTDGEAAGLMQRVLKNVREVYKVFGSRHPLMNKQSYPQLYYGWVKAIKTEYAHPNLDMILKTFLESFHERRLANLQLQEEQRDPSLIEYGLLMQQGTNDLQSMQNRSRILTKYLLEAHPEIQIKDPKRAFTDDERYVIWVRSGKQCQAIGCARPLGEIDDMHADHIAAWSNGGETSLENAQALCVDCNLKKSNSGSIAH